MKSRGRPVPTEINNYWVLVFFNVKVTLIFSLKCTYSCCNQQIDLGGLREGLLLSSGGLRSGLFIVAPDLRGGVPIRARVN